MHKFNQKSDRRGVWAPLLGNLMSGDKRVW